MRSLIIAIIFFIAAIWTIFDWVRFERSTRAHNDSQYASLYREHSLWRILLYTLVAVISALRFWGIE